MAYVDGILVLYQEVESHHQHLSQVLERIITFNLTVKLIKCSFFQTTVSFFGTSS